jgi:hypothetical protein
LVTIYTTSLTLKNSTSCPRSVFMCSVWIWEQKAIISLYNINWLVFITETECVYCAVRTDIFNVRLSHLSLRPTDVASSSHCVVSRLVISQSVLNYRGCSKEWSPYSNYVPVISFEGLSKNTINIRFFTVVMQMWIWYRQNGYQNTAWGSLYTDVMQFCSAGYMWALLAGTGKGGFTALGRSAGYRPSAGGMHAAVSSRRGLQRMFVLASDPVLTWS